METAYRMVQADNEGLQSRLHALEDELKTVKRELQEARDLLTEEADIEPGRSRVDSVSACGHYSSVACSGDMPHAEPFLQRRENIVARNANTLPSLIMEKDLHTYVLYVCA